MIPPHSIVLAPLMLLPLAGRLGHLPAFREDQVALFQSSDDGCPYIIPELLTLRDAIVPPRERIVIG
jgi:hypothetical protein